MPDDATYMATPEVDYLRFLVSIVDAIERADRWSEFIIEWCLGRLLKEGRPTETQ